MWPRSTRAIREESIHNFTTHAQHSEALIANLTLVHGPKRIVEERNGSPIKCPVRQTL